MIKKNVSALKKKALSSKAKASILSKKEKARVGTKSIVRAPNLSSKQSRILGIPKSSAKSYSSKVGRSR